MIQLSEDDRKVLRASRIEIDFGCDVLDDNGNVTDTLSPTWVADPADFTKRVVAGTSDILGGTVTHDSADEAQRSCDLRITKELDWGNVWLRPRQLITAYGHTVDLHLGVFRPVIPQLPMGQTPRTWTVHGMDRISMLQDIIGDTVSSPKGAVVGDELRAAILAAGVPGAIVGASDIGPMTLDRDMVWLLDASAPTTFIRRVNDLAAAGGVMPLYMDGDGRFMLTKIQPVAQQAAAWTFDADDKTTGIIDVDRSAAASIRSATNWWRFIVQDRTARPVEGVTQYTVDRSAGGRKVRSIVETDAADYDSLVAAGDRQIEADTSRTLTITVTARGYSAMEHRAIFDYVDSQFRNRQVQHAVTQQWITTLETAENKITLEIPGG